MFSRIKASAHTMNREFTLTEQEVFALVSSPCFYCKHPGSNFHMYSKHLPLVYNGIDRYDNNQGYTNSNAVTCCCFCNYAKHNKSAESLYKWFNRIRKHIPDFKLAAIPQEKNPWLDSTYRKLKTQAKWKKIAVNLSLEEFLSLSLAPCYYCGVAYSKYMKSSIKYPYDLYYNGLDRKDSSLNYIFENCLPCCWDCNRAKNDKSYEDFLTYLKYIKNLPSVGII